MSLTPDEAAAQRAAYVDALRYERDGYAARGQADRAAEVDAEIVRATGSPVGRRASGANVAATAPSAVADATDDAPPADHTTPTPRGRQRPATRRKG